jgi:hypothetical protein
MYRSFWLGITGYEAQMLIAPDGRIIEAIDLPRFKDHPEKQALLSFRAVKRCARRAGLKKPNEQAEMGYLEKEDIWYWELAERTFDDGLAFEERHIRISAHDGSVLGDFKAEGIR